MLNCEKYALKMVTKTYSNLPDIDQNLVYFHKFHENLWKNRFSINDPPSQKNPQAFLLGKTFLFPRKREGLCAKMRRGNKIVWKNSFIMLFQGGVIKLQWVFFFVKKDLDRVKCLRNGLQISWKNTENTKIWKTCSFVSNRFIDEGPITGKLFFTVLTRELQEKLKSNVIGL